MSDPLDSRIPKLSVVMPCLNEADTVAQCVEKALRAMREANINGEVVVADNGSTDGSQTLATRQGARVIHVTRKGYGAALMAGIEGSLGQYVIMGDADDSYDFLELAKFYDALESGTDLVQGCRLPRGGGRVLPGAMPWMHRWIGNPGLSWLVRKMFRVPVHDVYCGMRSFRRDFYDSLSLRSPGMEFATEMIIQSGLIGAKMSQVPITLHPDGRRQHGPHLNTFRDGWRTLKLFLIYNPEWTFIRPGIGLIAIAMLGYALAIPQVRVFGAAIDVHTLLVASLAGLLGWQCILLAELATGFAVQQQIVTASRRKWIWLDANGIWIGCALMCLGAAMIAGIALVWSQSGFGELNYPTTMRWVVPGVTLVAAGFQTVMATMLLGVLHMAKPIKQ